MRVKIIDAWSWGLPVVSTTIGAEGIDTHHENNILLVDDAQAFAQAVIRVLHDDNLAQNGHKMAIEKYNWRTIYPAWDEAYFRAISGGEAERNDEVRTQLFAAQ